MAVPLVALDILDDAGYSAEKNRGPQAAVLFIFASLTGSLTGGLSSLFS
jgi:hypothetical protein